MLYLLYLDRLSHGFGKFGELILAVWVLGVADTVFLHVVLIKR